MPKFNIKDLMVSLTASQEINHLCLNFTGCHPFSFCQPFSICHPISVCHAGCSVLLSVHTCVAYTCPGGTIACQFGTHPCGVTIPNCGVSEETTWKETSVIQQIIPALDVAELAELKIGLQGLIEKIDKEFRPAKLEQLDNLESKLNEAIKDVKDQKKKFS